MMYSGSLPLETDGGVLGQSIAHRLPESGVTRHSPTTPPAMKSGSQKFRDIRRNHHSLPTDDCAAMAQAEAMAHVAAALERQNELIDKQTELLEEIEQNTRRV